MTRRSAETHANFVLPHLKPGDHLLDIGCGPGTITVGLAKVVAPGEVVAVDSTPGQIEEGQIRAKAAGCTNLMFLSSSIYELPFQGREFDLVFAHAVFEHLKDPVSALREIKRVLKPSGLVALRSPDWGGFLIAPEISGLQLAIKRYTAIQTANSGDVQVGRKLPMLLRAAGIRTQTFSANYECYDPPSLIGEYLALQLESAGAQKNASSLRSRCRQPDAIFAQAWCEIVGIIPSA